jgi:TP901 family phage tail tape measure protein
MVQGALELIGVRAVIVDFRTYLNQSRQMEAATVSISKATQNVETASIKTAAAQRALDAVNSQVIAGNSRLAASILSVRAAQDKLNVSRNVAAQARPQDPTTGRFISRAQANSQVVSDQQALAAAQVSERSVRSSIPSIGAQTAARGAAAEAALVEAAAVDKLTAAEVKESELAASRNKLLTGTAAVAGAALFVGIGAASVKAASDYQQTLTKINVLTNTSTEDTQKLGKSFLELSKTLPSSPNELGAAAYFVLSSGINDVNEALDITKISAKDSAIGLGSVQDVAKNLTQIIVAYGEKNITAAQASDILVQAIKEGRAEAQDFAGSLGRVLPIAGAIGVKFDEVAASMAVLTNGGLSADEAATGLRAILNDLTKSSPQANKALALIGETANSIRQKIGSQGLTKTMLDLIQAFKGNLAAIEPIIPNIRGLVAASSAYISQGGKVEETLNRIRNSAGVSDEALKKSSETFSFQTKLLKNEFSVALIEIGTAILPTVTTAVKDLTQWFEANKASVVRLMQEGLKAFIEFLKDTAAGIGFVIDVLSWIPKNEATIAAAVIAIGAAFAWALPGSPYIKGLIFVLALLGQIQKGIKLPGVGKTGGSTLRTVAEVGGGILTGGAATILGGPVAGAIAGPVGFAATTALINEFFGEVGDDASDTKKAVDPLDAALDHFNHITLPDLKRNTSGVDEVDKQLAKDMQKLTASFKSSSEAAGDVDDFTKKLKLFGEVEKDVADAFNLDAKGAGAVQAADAEEAALDRLGKAHFNYVKTLATVANLIADGAENVARQTVLGLARGALTSSQAALNSVLGGTTREVAGLNVPLSESRLKSAQIDLKNDPQLFALKERSDAIEKDLKAIDKRQSEEDKKRKTRDDRLKDVFDKQTAILDNQLEALKYANDLAKNAYEVQAAQLQDLIDANKKSISDLQTAFLKNNEDLQNQINKAIGGGDTAGALALVRQQQTQTAGFRTANNVLNAQGQGLTTQQLAAEKAEKQREREAQLAEKQLETNKKEVEERQKSIESLNKQNDAIKDLILNTDNQKTALQNEKEKLDEHTATLNHAKDVQDQVSKKIQDQIAIYEAQTGILKAQGEAADNTLLSQQEQATVAAELIKQIGIESQAIRDLTTGPLGDLNTKVEDAKQEFDTLSGAIQVLTDDKIRGEFTSAIDGMAKRQEILAAADGKAGGQAKILGDNMETTSGKVSDWINDLLKGTDSLIQTWSSPSHSTTHSSYGYGGGVRSLLGNVFGAITDPIGGFLSGATLPHGLPGFAAGGFTGNRSGIVHPFEVVLPLNNQARARQIFGQLPAGFAASLNRGRNGPRSVFGDMNVQGSTLEDMRAMVHREVDGAFNRASSSSSRSGSLLSSGVGGRDY